MSELEIKKPKEISEAVKKRNIAKKNAARIIKLETLMLQKRQDMLSARLEKQTISRANRYAILGDEYHVRQELECGHDVDERNTTSGRTVLHEAISYGHFHLVRMLINDYDVDVHIPTMLGKATPLHLAVEFGFRQIASMLITFGADVNAQDGHGCTPLHRVKKLSLLKLLLKFPVDACIKSHEGLSPYSHYLKHTPVTEQVKEIIELMRAKEDARVIELTRQRIANTKNFREHYMKKMELITSGNSTIVSENNIVVKK